MCSYFRTKATVLFTVSPGSCVHLVLDTSAQHRSSWLKAVVSVLNQRFRRLFPFQRWPVLFGSAIQSPSLRRLIQRLASMVLDCCALKDLVHTGSYPSQATRPYTQEHRGLWRAMGLPKSAFITIVFLCLVLFLLVFSAGRIHAQRVMRHQATAVRGSASSQLPSTADQPLPGGERSVKVASCFSDSMKHRTPFHSLAVSHTTAQVLETILKDVSRSKFEVQCGPE